MGWTGVGIMAVALVVWAVVAYNRLQQLRNRVHNAYAQIDVQLKRRHDLIPNLVEVARGYMAHEAATLEAVTRARGAAVQALDQARNQAATGASLAAVASSEAALGSSLGRLMVLTEAYPGLKADAQMQQLSEAITSTENRVGYARQAYNDQVLAFNDRSNHFPDLIVARLLGFVPLPMLQATESAAERQAPVVRF